MFKRFTLIFFCWVCPLLVSAQLTQAKYGQNRLQYKEFNWRYYSTNNFDIYFYDDGQQLAKMTADFMEEEYERLTDMLGYAPYSKTKVFLYNSIADMQQSNVGINDVQFSVGGKTDFVKNHVQVAFPGSLRDFRQELMYKVSKMLITDMMFGGNLGDIFQSSYLMTLPDWFIEGAARYVAYGWDEEMDDYVRELFKDGDNQKINRLDGLEAALAGQSVWNFIAEKYGYANISNILNYTRIIRNERTAIANTLGIPEKAFFRDWRAFYIDMARSATQEYSHPSGAEIIAERKKGLTTYNSVALSPDGKLLAYTENKQGRYHINIHNLESGKTKTVLKTGYRVLDQEADDTIPLVAWQNDETLGVIGVKRGQYVLYLHSIVSGRTGEQVISRISQVNNFSFSPNGKVLVMSAEKNGQNDIYLYSIARRTLRAITTDVYDDITPAFMPGSNNIIFSSNRTTDSLVAGEKSLGEVSSNYNLYVYDIDTTNRVLAQITNTLSKDYMPQVDSTGNIYFLSDQRGIVNLFRYNLQDSLYKQVTAFSTGIEDYSLRVEDGGEFAYISMVDGVEKIFYWPGWSPSTNRFTSPTQRQQVKQAKYVLRQRRNRPEETVLPQEKPQQEDVVEEALPEADTSLSVLPPLVTDSLQNQPDSLISLPPDSLFVVETPADTAREEGYIDPDNYVFEEEVLEEAELTEPEQPERRSSFLTRYRQLRKENTLRGPFRQETRFMFNSLVTSIAIDPLRSSLGTGGFGFVLEGEVTDMLQDHRIYGGVLAMTDLRSGDLFLEYDYLKYLVDYGVRYDRRVVIQEFASNNQSRYVLNDFKFTASLPLNVSSRVTIGPRITNTRYFEISANTVSSRSSAEDDLGNDIWYAGGIAEYTFDNTRVRGFNLLNGTRIKAKYEHILSLNESDWGFGKLTGEISHYQPISREITLAVRGFGGHFVTDRSPVFILGGMDNWLFNKREEGGGDNPFLDGFEDDGRLVEIDNRNLLFHEFVMPLRGFRYNAFNGKNVLAASAELRFPIFRYFVRGPITSNFFRNFLAVSFFDIGSSWSGRAPFFRSNSINTEEVNVGGSGGDGIRATINNFKNPWLSSYGVGVRTVLLGYYLKFDLAWPIEDYEVQDKRFYITFGYDF